MTTDAAPPRRTLAVFDDYEAAQRAVDHLSDHDFPVDRVSIVGRDLRFVEQVTGRMTTASAAAMGALHGAVLGALFGLAFGLIFTFSPSPAVWLLIIYGVVTGGLFGALFGALTHAMGGGQRDFASVRTMTADRYELVVDEDVAERALEQLRELGVAAADGGRRGVPT